MPCVLVALRMLRITHGSALIMFVTSTLDWNWPTFLTVNVSRIVEPFADVPYETAWLIDRLALVVCAFGTGAGAGTGTGAGAGTGTGVGAGTGVGTGTGV